MYISNQNGGGFTGTKIGDHNLGGAAATLFTQEINSDIENGKIKPNAPPAQLYDLKTDPFEKKNVYYEHPKVVIELQTLLNDAINVKKSTRPK